MSIYDDALAGLRSHLHGWYTFDNTTANVHAPGTNEIAFHPSAPSPVYVPGKCGSAIRRQARFNQQMSFSGTSGQDVISFAGWCRFPSDQFIGQQFSSGSSSVRQRVELVGDDLHWQHNPISSNFSISYNAFPGFEGYRTEWNHYAWSVRFGVRGEFRAWLNGGPTMHSEFSGDRIPAENFHLYSHDQTELAGIGEFDEVVLSLVPWRDAEISALYNDGEGASYPLGGARGFPLSRLVN